MDDNIYNNTNLVKPKKVLDINDLNYLLRNSSNTSVVKSKLGHKSNILNKEVNPKHVLYLYHNNYISQVNELKSFRETETGGGYSVFLEQINPELHDFNYVRQKIIQYYNNRQIKYVVIFGSKEEVPTIMLDLPSDWEDSTFLNKNSTSASSDIYYGHFNNREYKVIVGRLSPGDNKYSYFSSSSELSTATKKQNIQNQVDKIKQYETFGQNLSKRNSLQSSETWTKKIIGIASNEGGSDYGIDGLSDNVYMRQELEKFRTRLNCQYSELYDSYSNSGHIGNPSTIQNNINYDKWGNPSTIDFINKVNDGASLLLYVGHANETQISTTNFSVLNSEHLSNRNKYFLGCVVGCSIGSHDEDYMSLAEDLQVSPEKGSIAMFSSSILQSWTAPMYMQRQMNDVITQTNKTLTIGEIFEKSVENADFKNNVDYYYYHLLGDPCTRFILTIPQVKRNF